MMAKLMDDMMLRVVTGPEIIDMNFIINHSSCFKHYVVQVNMIVFCKQKNKIYKT